MMSSQGRPEWRKRMKGNEAAAIASFERAWEALCPEVSGEGGSLLVKTREITNKSQRPGLARGHWQGNSNRTVSVPGLVSSLFKSWHTPN